MLQPDIRNAVRAVIVKDQQILVLRKQYPSGEVRYALPGGGQEPGETLEAALHRECREEIDASVTVVGLRHVADYFRPRECDPQQIRHLVEFLFECRVEPDYQPSIGPEPDSHQTGVVWLSLDSAEMQALHPRGLIPFLQGHCPCGANAYLGSLA